MSKRLRLLNPYLGPLFLMLAAAGGLLGQVVPRLQPTAIPFPVLVYQIEAESEGHHASLLNLPIGQPGVPQTPMPVDIDGDLLPDITAAVNLVNLEGALLNPPQLGAILAPNVEINRLITAPILGQRAKPLKIQVVLRITDLQNTQPDTVVKFGYDTGPGGSIPTYWKATLGGLDKFFNPLQAVIDTAGENLGLSPGISDFRLQPIAPPYQGPLSIIGNIKNGPDLQADINLRFHPFPNAIQLNYGSDDLGQHVTYAHGSADEVDLDANITLETDEQILAAHARIDRIPRFMQVDFGGDQAAGTADFNTNGSGRLPDIGVDLLTTPKDPALTPLNVNAAIESLPDQLHGEWNINKEDEQIHAAFSGSGSGLGAVEATVKNYLGNPTALVPWIPDQQQFANLQMVPLPGGGTEQLIQARIERVRSATFDQDGGGMKATVAVGDGELPLLAHVGIDLRQRQDDPLTEEVEEPGPLVDGRVQISPLPDLIEFSLTPPGEDQEEDPLKLRYEASQTIDVDANAKLVLPDAPVAECGRVGTICANVALRNIPAEIEARIIDLLDDPEHPESRIEVDLIPRPGAPKPDLVADVTYGQSDIAPLVAHAEMDGISKFIRFRTVQGAAQTLERVELHMCDRDWDNAVCEPGTEDEVSAVRANVRDWLIRPPNLPPPTSSAPLFAGVTARGDAVDPNLVRFEADARVTNIRELQYINDGDTTAARARIGGGKDLVVDLDAEDIALDNDDPASERADIKANALISPLPDDLTFCLRQAGGPLGTSSDPATAPCHSDDPFGDGTADESPLTVGFLSSAVFRTEVHGEAILDKATPGNLADDVRAVGDLRVERLPQNFSAKIGMPEEGSTEPIRVLTDSDFGNNIDVAVHGELGVGGANCNEPDPSGDNVCGDLLILGLPLLTSALIGGAKNKARAEFHACDYLFFDVTPACRPGTASQIESLTVDGRAVLGNPGALGALEPETDMHAILQARMPSEDDIAFRARARFEKIRSVFFRQSADGFDAGYDLGDGTKPFEAKAQLDTRSGIGGPLPTGLRLDGKVKLTPLPQRVTVGQHGDGTDAPMVMSYDATSDIDLDAYADVALAKAGATPSCGDDGTACATLDIDNIPAQFIATLGRTETPGPLSSVDQRTTIKTQYANLNGPDKVDVRAEAIAGLPTTTPIVGATPVRAKLELLGLPRFVTAFLDEHVDFPGLPKEARNMDRVAVQTCNVLPSGSCQPLTEDKLDSIYAEIGTYLVRPLGMPGPGAGITDPLWAHIAGRGNDIQAAVKLVNIREVQYVNDKVRGLTAAKARVGDNNPLTVKVDVEDLPLGDIVLGALAVNDATLDLHANARINPLPSEIGICLRSSGKPIGAATGNLLTAVCEDATPFEDADGDPVGVSTSPLSFNYHGSVPINAINVEADIATNGIGNVSNQPIDARRLYGKIDVLNVPTDITAHVQTPVDDANGNPTGATRVRYEAPSPGPGITIGLRAHQTIGDAVCQDPRKTHLVGLTKVEGPTALCVGATLRDLPQELNVFWDPAIQSDNLLITTDSNSAGKLDLDDLELSSVKPRLNGSGVSILDKADVLVATGAVLGIDHEILVTGNLGLPVADGGTGRIDLNASVEIEEITATVKNFIAPNPFTAAIPDRPVNKHPLVDSGGDSILNTASFRQRGEAFLAEATIRNVAGFGYRAVTTNGPNPVATGTSVINVNFGKDFAVRAYADIAPDNTTRIIGDVLLEQIPAGLSFCFRGPKDPLKLAGAGQANYCDDPTVEAKADDGAFQFLGSPLAPHLNGLDLDAFVRVVSGSTTNILSGRLNIDNIAYRIEGAIPAGGGERLDVSLKNKLGAPDGIDQIRFAFATFDLPRSGTVNYPDDLESGYTSLTPGYSPLTTAKAPFPPATDPGQFLSGVAAFSDIQVAGRLGGLVGPASRLQRIRYAPDPCPNTTPPRPDYPFFPLTDGSSYTCIRADLQQTHLTPDPLALHFVYRADDGNEVKLTNAGINDLPAYIQMTMSETKIKDGPDPDPEKKDILRRRCRSNTVETTGKTQAQIDAITDCMPPKIRFDQPLDTARLFGVLEVGKPADITALNGVIAKGALANTMALPQPATWEDWDVNNNDDPQGVRFRILETAGGGMAARASLRVPIPASLTVAHPQTTDVSSDTDKANYYTASDTRFHYIVRDSLGASVASLGQLTGMMQQDDGTQILVGAPCAKLPQERKRNIIDIAPFDDLIYQTIGAFLPLASQYNCDQDYVKGVPIPGEIGISMYDRTHKGDGKSMIRIDGRVSTAISAGVRMFGGDPTGIGFLEAEIKDVPGTGAGVGPDDASFRLQYMSHGKGEDPPNNAGGGGGPPEPPEPCVFCTETNVRLERVFASFDFRPAGSANFARLVNATLRSDGLKNGLEIQSFTGVQGGAHTPVRVVADAKINPLDFQAHLDLVPVFDDLADKLENFIENDLGLPGWIADVLGFVVRIVGRLIANLVHVRVELESRLEAGLDIQTQNFEFRQNLLTVRAENHGGGHARLGPFDLYVKQLEAYAAVGVRINLPWPLPDIVIGFTLLHIYFLPAFHDLIPFNLNFIDCANPVTAIVTNFVNLPPPFMPNAIEIPSGTTRKIVIWPFQDQRVFYGGFLGPLVKIASMLAGPFFCFMGVDDSDIPLGAPTDPVTASKWTGHPIFDSALLDPSTLAGGASGGIGGTPPDPAPPAPPPPAPLPAPHPDYTINAGLGDISLCGIHEFGVLTIDNLRTLSVGTSADGAAVPVRSGDPARVRCLAADVGSLTIIANRIINNGTIQATGTQTTNLQPQGGPNPIYTGNPASGNSGGGHHDNPLTVPTASGGTGSQGTGGDGFTDPDGRTSGLTERGMPGAGSAKGNGGGVIQLLVEPRPFRPNPALHEISYEFGDIQSTGTIRANGTDGGSDTTGVCGSPASNGPDGNPGGGDDVAAVPFTGVHAPGGGGAGGGIVLAASRLDLSGPVQAFGGNGGAGKAGGGGGGGGGVIKLIAPVQRLLAGFSPNVNGGAAGGGQCAGPGTGVPNFPAPAPVAGNPGLIGDRVDVTTPTAGAQDPATFWNRVSVSVPVRGEGSYSGSTPSGFDIYICGIVSAATAPPPFTDNAPVTGTPGPEDVVFSLADNYTVPLTNTAGDPCGSATQLATKSFSGFVIDPADAAGFVNVPLAGAGNNGVWGTWAIAVRGGEVTRQPKKVQSIFGIDNSPPTVNITAPADNPATFETTSIGVGLNFDSADQAALSGVALIECRNSVAPTTAFQQCASGATFNLAPGNGSKQITVRVTDLAGNIATDFVDGTLAGSPPTADAHVQGGTVGGGGWYTSAPSFLIDHYVDTNVSTANPSGIPIEPTGGYAWRFDDLPETICVAGATCTVPTSAFDALPPGEHTLYVAAINRLGLRLYGDEMLPFGPFKWDKLKPQVELTLVPRDPDTSDGSNLWFTDRPFVVVSGVDGFGESGLGSTQVDTGSGFVNFTAPFELPNGTHNVSVRSFDVAGNVSDVSTKSNVRVDDAAPDVDISLAGGVPGLAGWFKTAPTVTINNFADNALGAGAPTTGRIRYRVDNGAEQLCSPSCVVPALGTGTHLIGAYGVDAVQNAGSETEGDGNVTLKVDGEHPDTAISVRLDAPDGVNDWYRRDLPWVEFTSTDQGPGYGQLLPFGSGVDFIEKSLDGGATWTPYTGPFQIAGGNDVCARATDVAGNQEPSTNCRIVKGDNIDPIVGLSVAGVLGGANWYLGDTTVTVSSVDFGGSGLFQPGQSGTPCWWQVPGAPNPIAPVPAGTCVSVDGRPFEAIASGGSVVLGEGEHEVRAFARDAAGNRSAVATTIVNVDKSAPVPSLRLLPRTPRSSGWYRIDTPFIVRSVDGDQNSGVDTIEVSIDGLPFVPYTGPGQLGEGRRTIQLRSKDFAGREFTGPLVPVNVDHTPAFVKAMNPEPATWLKFLNSVLGLGNILAMSPAKAKLKWQVSDDIAKTAHVKVLVFNQTGAVVRQLDHGSITLVPGQLYQGFTHWDGRDFTLTGLVPVGLYYYRVVVVDEAGNISQSGESKPMQVKVG